MDLTPADLESLPSLTTDSIPSVKAAAYTIIPDTSAIDKSGEEKEPEPKPDPEPEPKPEPEPEPETESESTPTLTKEAATPTPTPTEKAEPPPRYAIVSSVWDSKYASMALMLGYSLKQHNRIAELGIEMILLTIDGDDGAAGITVENATRLERVGWRVHLEPQMKIEGLDTAKIMPHRRKNLNKLKIFGWEQYEKIIFIDADTICKGSIEELFTMPGGMYLAFSLCLSC